VTINSVPEGNKSVLIFSKNWLEKEERVGRGKRKSLPLISTFLKPKRKKKKEKPIRR
jgi:hypothetical protein